MTTHVDHLTEDHLEWNASCRAAHCDGDCYDLAPWSAMNDKPTMHAVRDFDGDDIPYSSPCFCPIGRDHTVDAQATAAVNEALARRSL